MEDQEPEEPPIVPNKETIQFGGKNTTYDLDQAADDFFTALDQSEPTWLEHGLNSRTGDMVHFSKMKLKNEEEKILEAIMDKFENGRFKQRNQTKGYFQDDLTIDLTKGPAVDKKWRLKANPEYAKRLRDANIADFKKMIMKKLQMKVLDRIRNAEMKRKEKTTMKEMRRSQKAALEGR